MFIIDWFKNAVRAAFTPPPVPSTDRELTEAERDIEHAAELVESNVRAEWVRRARSMVGRGFYCLGAGGRDPKAPTPFGTCNHPDEHTHDRYGKAIFCDCSGFLCWVIRRLRHDKASDRWLNTDEMERLAKPQRIPWHMAVPGDIVVYGAGKAIGHCGLVVEVDDSGPIRVVHCQASKAPAVTETSAELFFRKGAVIWRP